MPEARVITSSTVQDNKREYSGELKKTLGKEIDKGSNETEDEPQRTKCTRHRRTNKQEGATIYMVSFFKPRDVADLSKI